MKNKKALILIWLLFLFISLTVLPQKLHAQSLCMDVFAITRLSVLEAIEREQLDDTTMQPVFFTRPDLSRMVTNFPLNLRSEFQLVVLKTRQEQTLLALVAKNNSPQTGTEGQLLNQQVMQWQLIPIAPENILRVENQTGDGALRIIIRRRNFFGFETTGRLKTKILVARKLNIEPTSFNELVQYLRDNPRNENSARRSLASDLLRFLFGRAWVQIFGPRLQLNALQDSRALLDVERVIVPGKVKHLHVVGQIFTAEFNITPGSPYSGHLAPGKYFALGRLSSSMKNLEIENAQGNVEKNSLAMGILLFRTQNQKEQPGILFVQDSLLPVENPGLTQFQLTNNPGFKFSPTSIREFFEQGFTVVGVGLSSLLNSRDSGRGVQGNYRSTLGAATDMVSTANGDVISAPRFIALQYNGALKPAANTYVESLSSDPAASFTVRTSDDGTHWSDLGHLQNIDWMGIDSHELTFPHGFGSTINPQVLLPAASTVGIRGLELPVEIIPENSPIP